MSRMRRFHFIDAVVVLVVLQSAGLAAQGIRYARVSRETVEQRLRKFGGDDRRREETLKQFFTDAGCGEHISEQAVKGATTSNVICVLPGSSQQVIIVGAHFDHIAAGDGVVDNWSGASLLPSLYESVKSQPRKHTYIFVGFTEEEKGLVGSHSYVQNMSKEQVAATDAMVNMDTLGLGPTKVWGSHSDQLLIGALGYVAKQLKMPVAIVDVEQVGSTDSEQFAARKIPHITIHSLTQEKWQEGILHTSKDKISAMNLDDYYQTYSLVAAYLAFLDEMPGGADEKSPK